MKLTWLGGPEDGRELVVEDHKRAIEVALDPDIKPYYADALAHDIGHKTLTVPIDRERGLLLWYQAKLNS